MMTDESLVGDAETSDASAATTAERSRRYRERRRSGKLMATVEIDDTILALLAYGTKSEPGTLRADRTKLSEAAGKALRFYAKRYAQTGSVAG
jgi:hypothetical protein